MDIYKEWQKINLEKFKQQSITQNNIMEAIHQNSKTPLEGVKKGLSYKIRYIIFFTIAIMVLMVLNWNNSSKLILLGVFGLYMITGWIVLRIQLKKLKSSSDQIENLHTLLHKYYYTLKDALRFEETLGAFFLPLSVVIGYLYARIDDGETFLTVFSDPRQTVALLITIIIVVPIIGFVSKWMNKKAFGTYLEQLKMNLDLLEYEENYEEAA